METWNSKVQTPWDSTLSVVLLLPITPSSSKMLQLISIIKLDFFHTLFIQRICYFIANSPDSFQINNCFPYLNPRSPWWWKTSAIAFLDLFQLLNSPYAFFTSFPRINTTSDKTQTTLYGQEWMNRSTNSCNSRGRFGMEKRSEENYLQYKFELCTIFSSFYSKQFLLKSFLLKEQVRPLW